jgi:hypothetical protein
MPTCNAPGERRRRLGWRLRRAALTFEADVLLLLSERRPDDLSLLVALGQVYARLRRHRQGLAIDRRLVAARPDEPTFRYNLACSLALTGDLNGACRELLAAIDRGYRDLVHLMADDDLSTLRVDPRFGLVLDRLDAAQPAG